MTTKFFSSLWPVFAAILSGVLLVLAFPDYNISWLAWVGLVPLLLGLQGRNPLYGYFFCFVFSVVFFTGICIWVFDANKYTLIHHALIMLFLGAPLALFGLAFCFLARRIGAVTALAVAPCIWVVLEYVRSNLSFFALPWGFLAHSQSQNIPFIQISEITGAYGVSFLVVMANAGISMAIVAFTNQTEISKRYHVVLPSRKTALSLTVVSAVMSCLVWLYGELSLSGPLSTYKIKISIVQGNIEQEKKYDPKFKPFIMERYTELSKTAAKDQPRLIVWPEAATPGFILMNKALRMQLVSLIKESNTYYLVGSSEFPKFQGIRPRLTESGNTALFFSPEGEHLDTYLKIHLFPFTEYIPYAKVIPWPNFIVPEEWSISDVAGKKMTLFEIDGSKFGALICWETIFPNLFRKFVKNGANFMLNITNEGWFQNPALFHQYVSMNIFRAVENRVSLTRAANTGVSCFIDPFGRVTGRVSIGDKDVKVKGYLTQEISLSTKKTFYTNYGDVFVYLNVIIVLMIFGIAILRKERDYSKS